MRDLRIGVIDNCAVHDSAQLQRVVMQRPYVTVANSERGGVQTLHSPADKG